MWGGSERGSVRLPEGLVSRLGLVELGREGLGGPGPEGLLDEPAGLPALGPREAPRLDGGLAPGVDGDLDRLHEAPPSWIVNRIEPSARGCSTTPWPFFRASRRAFSIA